ncbi:hypothetical protein fugu_009816 [Takifugu bimaculatus]|uniref:Uncharacterized protein n=1 Tax=Takifugu bimaculatus TaxID=433685 RepID=A0A4Z2CDR9_9TELE|nr:hypothetical protein fugu_009816 [Takifugu bimaculatus]
MKADEKRKHNYTWAIVRSQCSATCAAGLMNTKTACYKDMRVQVNTSYCNPRSRPVTGLVPCNTQPCPASWSVGEWGACSQSCGGGEHTRLVQCIQRTSQTDADNLSDAQCIQPAPARRQACNTHSCPPVWSTGPWSQCSRKCGSGLRKRTVLCTSTKPGVETRTLPDSLCAGLPKPGSQESCFIKRCQKLRKVQWFVSTWQECSATCGRGYQTRFIKCAEKDTAGKYRELTDKKCHHVPKPAVELQRPCVLKECPVRTTPALHRWSPYHHTFPQPLPHPPPPAEWRSSPWSQCTVTCGGGVQSRTVQCLVQGKPSSGCAFHLKPLISQACNTNFCPQPDKKGITSTGATWFLNMECATTSSTASSAASPAQTQTYNLSPSPQRCPHSDVYVFLWHVAGEDITAFTKTRFVGSYFGSWRNVRDAECAVVLKHERAIGNLFQSFLLHLVFVDPIQIKAFLGNGLTMMPGDTQSSALPIAADATVGTCQNCAVLHQNLNEYVSSFLALKQKIAVSDDSIRLQQTLEELQIRLVTLEKKTADYESLQAELEEKQDALKTYTQMSEEFGKLKQENGRTLTEKQILEDQLKDAKELTETQSLENAKLMREKAVVENDLLKTQTLLKKSQEQADQVEKLKEENANIINTKSRLETKVTQLEDSICKQNNQIAQLSKEKNQLERKIDDLQVRLIKLEKEKRKEYKSTSTQAVAPKEPKVDKEKIRMLLEGLWACVETQQQDSENQLHFRESRPKQIRLPSPQHEQRSSLSYTSPSATHTSRETCSFPAHSDPTLTRINPPGSTPTSHQAHLPSQSAKKEKHSPKKEHKNKQPLEDFINSPFSLEDVMTLFKPMPSCISPLQDLEAEIESMEIDKGEKENHLLPASTSISPQKKESVVITLESKCENSPAAPIPGEFGLARGHHTIKGTEFQRECFHRCGSK